MKEKSFHILPTLPNSPQLIQVLFCYSTTVHRNSSFIWPPNCSTKIFSIYRVSFLQLDCKWLAQGWWFSYSFFFHVQQNDVMLNTFLFKLPSKQMGWKWSKSQWIVVGNGLEFRLQNSMDWVPSQAYHELVLCGFGQVISFNFTMIVSSSIDENYSTYLGCWFHLHLYVWSVGMAGNTRHYRSEVTFVPVALITILIFPSSCPGPHIMDAVQQCVKDVLCLLYSSGFPGTSFPPASAFQVVDDRLVTLYSAWGAVWRWVNGWATRSFQTIS